MIGVSRFLIICLGGEMMNFNGQVVNMFAVREAERLKYGENKFSLVRLIE